VKDKHGKWEDLTIKMVNNKDDDDERDNEDDQHHGRKKKTVKRTTQRLSMKNCKKMYISILKRLEWWIVSCLKEETITIIYHFLLFI